MKIRSVLWPSTWRRRFVSIAVVLVALYALLGFVVVPLVAPSQLSAALSSALGREARVGSVTLNPFSFTVSVGDFALADLDGEAMIELRELEVDLELASAWKRAVILDELRLDGLMLHAHTNAEGRNNLAALGDTGAAPVEEEAPAEDEPSSIPPITIRSLALDDVRATFRDDSAAEPFTFEVGPLELQLSDFSTRPDSQSPYAIKAVAPSGEELAWEGTITLEPLQSSGRIELANLSLSRLWRYLRGTMPLDLEVTDCDIAVSYELARDGDEIAVRIFDGGLQVSQAAIQLRGEEARLIAFERLEVDRVALDLADQAVRIGRVGLDAGVVELRIDSEGSSNFARLTSTGEAAAPDEEPAAADPAGDPWHVDVETIEVRDMAFGFRDEAVSPAAELRLEPIDVEIKGLSTRPGKTLKVQATAGIGTEGKIDITIDAGLDPMNVEGTLRTAALPLPTFAGYMRNVARVSIPSGLAASEGQLALSTGEDGATLVRYSGDAEIRDLVVRTLEAESDILRWQRLGLVGVAVDTGAGSVVIERLELEDPFADVALDADGNLTLNEILITEAEAAPAEAQPAGEEAATLGVQIREIRLTGGTLRFADRSVQPSFQTSLDGLQVSLGGLDLADLGGIALDLSGRIDEDAPLTIKGTLSPPGHAKPADVAISLSGYDLTAVTPYVGRYVGYGVDRGKLSLDLDYRLDRKTLRGKNSIVAKRFALGDRVESPDATSLPVKLALAVLRNSKGEIELDVPVRGDVDDPQFTLGGTILSTFTNVLQRAVTSPFSILSSIVGIGADELSHIEFAAGSDRLAEGEVGKVDALAKALTKRPGLILEIRGAADMITDRAALANEILDARLRQVWMEQEGIDARSLGDRPVELEADARRMLLEDEYRTATGSRPSTNEGESPDAYAARLEQAVRERISVSEADVAELGKRRSRIVRDALEGKGVPREQLFRVKAKTVFHGKDPVPLELSVSTGG